MTIRFLMAISVSAAAASASSAGVLLETSMKAVGDAAADRLGHAVSGAGDVNNDGFDDFIAGAPLDDDNGADSGSARVYSGAGGGILYTFYGAAAGLQFGHAVSGAGDMNNDGFDDVIVGSGAAPGGARVFSGANGSILYNFVGDQADDHFGWSVGGAGDVNNDGFADLIVGAHDDDNNGAGSGMARVFSGATGTILYSFDGDSAGDRLGFSVGSAGDVNNDGFDDVIVGADQDDNHGNNSGMARVFSGATGAILYTIDGDAASDAFGSSVAGAGDVNNDGLADFIVGAPLSNANGADAGSVRVFFRFLYPPCPGDADQNGTVNFADITNVLTNFNLMCP